VAAAQAHDAHDAAPIAAPAAAVRLHRIVVRDFRNLERITLELPAEGLVLVGDNGQGKTNLLEAIHYLTLLRSMRGARDTDLVRFGAPAFHLSADAEVGRPRGIGVGFARAGKRKKVTLDGVEVTRLSEAFGAVPSVVVAPSDVELVIGAPALRRRYLDLVLALSSRRYLHALQGYRGALLRRNAALRDALRAPGDVVRVAVWEPALAEHGSVLWEERAAWVSASAEAFARLCASIGEPAPMAIRYQSSLAVDHASPEARSRSTREALAAALDAKRALDIRRCVTHAGPHRDDLELTLGGRPLRLFGSAGQQRTAALALRLLEHATLRERGGVEPLLLLDDPFAELDARRAERILALLGRRDGSVQVVLAVPRASDIPAEMLALPRRRVEGGVIDATRAMGDA
jgi:DNA replication and repair protein RecF